MDTSALEARRQAASDSWTALESSQVPVVYVGAATCGRAAGAQAVADAAAQALKERVPDGRVVQVGCIGPCYLEPLMDVQLPGLPRVSWANVTAESAKAIIEKYVGPETVIREGLVGHFGGADEMNGVPRFFDHPMLKPQVRVVLRNCGIIDPSELDHYLARDGYTGLVRALEMGPQALIEQIKQAGLRGRGGAGFPTGIKWELCRNTPADQRYMICNADEGDPGAFMNRSLLEGDPHAMLEGLAIASFAIGASVAYVYIRAEYPLAIERLQAAIAQMRELGLLGKNILGTGFDLEIKIKEGAGAFVCGEETAMIASLEGLRGMPRTRPPFPASSGLWQKPTIINNVETLATVPTIVRRGAEWYAQYGTETSKGTKTFSLVGKVVRTGLIEVPMGMSLKQIIFEVGGGIQDDKLFKAVQTGGPSGGCIPSKHLDIEVDYESLQKAGAIMGSGGMIVVDEDVCAVDLAHYFLSFTQLESCGKCVPCRIGTRQMKEILDRIKRGDGQMADIAKLDKLAQTIKSASLCGLGQTAPNPVLTTLRFFRDEYEAHIEDKRCEAFDCTQLVGAPCQSACPVGTEAWRYVAHIARGEFEEAYRAIRKHNPFPSICARVCDHRCEKHCRLGSPETKPVAIRMLKRFVTDRMDPGTYRPEPEVSAAENGQPVAIVGAGPAGLTAAHNLSLKGYQVTVFEADSKPGGMLHAGVPTYRLPRDVMDKEIEALIDDNITLRCNTALGRDITIDQMFDQGFKAVFLALGAHDSLPLKIPGEDAAGVHPSMAFLKAWNIDGKALAKGKVGIIGGGNSAIDAARVALRQPGVDRVTIYYRRTRNEMPAFETEIEAALEEGVELDTLVSPIGIHVKEGRLGSLELIRNELGEVDSSGRRRPVPSEGTEHLVELDTLIVAISEQPQSFDLKGSDGLEFRWNRLVVDQQSLATARADVFAGGDVVTGPNTVIDAIATGQKAAVMIDRHLKQEGFELAAKLQHPTGYVAPCTLTETDMKRPRVDEPMVPAADRTDSFVEVELELAAELACAEAKRCLRCDLEFTKPPGGTTSDGTS